MMYAKGITQTQESSEENRLWQRETIDRGLQENPESSKT